MTITNIPQQLTISNMNVSVWIKDDYLMVLNNKDHCSGYCMKMTDIHNRDINDVLLEIVDIIKHCN